jgi:hypothetical protein
MPAIFGLTCANIVLTTLAEYPVPQLSLLAASKIRPRLYADIHAKLKTQYDSFGKPNVQPNCPFSEADVGYIVEEVFRGRSILEPYHTTRLTLGKWRPEGTLTWGNVVCMTKAESIVHETRVIKGGESVDVVYGQAVVSRVTQIWQEEEEIRGERWGMMYSTKTTSS